MSTSGSTSYTLTTNDLIAAALEKLGVATEGEALTADMYQRGLRALNLMLKTWTAVPRLWLKTEGWLPLVAGQAPYTLTAAKRVLSVRRRIISGSLDTPMNELAREDYFNLPNKSQQATPVSWYFDPQDTTPKLYLWPTASTAVAAQQQIEFTYLRTIEDMVASNNNLDLPQEWLETVVYNLAQRLMTAYPVNDPILAAEIRGMAKQLYDNLSGWDTEPASLYLQPDTRWS